MLKKIQQYLLLHYPLLWNIRIVPVLLGAILINLFFFLIGLLSTEINFSTTYSFSYSDTSLIYFGSVISSILLLTFWLISYSKNNAFKIFYPKNSAKLYVEWLLIFIICMSIAIIPFSFYEGSVQKIKSYASEEETQKAIAILNTVDILIPETKNFYYQEYPDEIRPQYEIDATDDYPTDIAIATDTVVLDDSAREETLSSIEMVKPELTFPDYPDFRQLSLLNYNGYNGLYFSYSDNLVIPNHQTVIQWLKNKDKEKIAGLMNDFLELEKKHNLTSNLSKDKWMQLVYKPNKYPVGDFNLISRSNPNTEKYTSYLDDDSYMSETSSGYYLNYTELSTAYREIWDVYHDGDSESKAHFFFMFTVIFALSLSLIIFSFRVSSGRSWLIAFVSIALIIVGNAFLSLLFTISSKGDYGGFVLFVCVLLGVFIAVVSSIASKISSQQSKGKSIVYINHLIWLLPIVPVLITSLVYLLSEESCRYNQGHSGCLHEFIADYLIELIWSNICLTFLTMWIFVRFILLKWKGLAED